MVVECNFEVCDPSILNKKGGEEEEEEEEHVALLTNS